jgi:hypothetical protein
VGMVLRVFMRSIHSYFYFRRDKKMKIILIFFCFYVNGCRSKTSERDGNSSPQPTGHAETHQNPTEPPSPTEKQEEKSYSEVGNAGDFAAIAAEAGRQYGANILSRIREDSFPNNMDSYLDESEFDWLVTHLNEVRVDLLNSKIVWVETYPSGCKATACGCAFANDDKIFLSVSACNSSSGRSKHDWAKLLTHESLHHFVGNDEGKAKKFGVALAAAWYKWAIPTLPTGKYLKGHFSLKQRQNLFFTKIN